MLASIHPLGERGRGQSFTVTLVAYSLGSVAAAAALGALLGAVGHLVLRAAFGAWRPGILAGAAVIAAVVDRSGGPVPSWRRQVNEDWLASYRGWVYGLGFGAQLGLGVVTIVTTASVHLAWVGAFVAASAAAGGIVGAAFGFARALPLLASRSVRTPDAIGARVAGVEAWAGRFRTVTVAADVVVALALVAVAVR